MKKISFEWETDRFLLFGFRCVWESFRLAFHLNRALQIRLERTARDLDCYHKMLDAQACYPRYAYFDKAKEQHWFLIENRARIQQSIRGRLFEESEYQVYLVPERKEIDCFLKVAQAEVHMGRAILKRIIPITGLHMAVEIDAERLKSKRNLIF